MNDWVPFPLGGLAVPPEVREYMEDSGAKCIFIKQIKNDLFAFVFEYQNIPGARCEYWGGTGRIATHPFTWIGSFWPSVDGAMAAAMGGIAECLGS